jgi:dTDP-4-dehydrorhamnose reductase
VAPELWGGIECTVNRVGDRFGDQVVLSGHQDRVGDLALLAGLGIRALRYPLLWERISPRRGAEPDWRWSDRRLAELRALGVRPIAGLVHHGSGPAHTNLLDDGFAAGLARHAGAVARRYPWIEEWTPINEPLTTARFTALYGHWYPHRRDERSFWSALLNQVDAVRGAMRAIRRVVPGARLVQTDDLGHTFSTAPLAGQAAFDNMRRWAGWDLLFGRVTPADPLFAVLARHGLGDRVRAIADDPCPPDIVGVNHYLTSDRFLDHRVDRYPSSLHGGNGRVAYADTEAARVLDPPAGGIGAAIRAAWARYGTPVAITEVHNGSTRDEQLRWAAGAWDAAVAARGDGVDVRAVTAWSLLGSHGWDTLLTGGGHYEPGVFDVGTGTPRPTALARLWRGLPRGEDRHPVAIEDGWWRRPDRLLYPPHPSGEAASPRLPRPSRPLLILGAGGMLGAAFVRACRARGIAHVAATRRELDVTSADLPALIAAIAPWGVVNAAAHTAIDAAEENEDACRHVNAGGAVALARACAGRGIPSLNFSSELVFAGDLDRALVESDAARPLGAHGRIKSEMERGCHGVPGALVVRTAALYAPEADRGFAAAVVAALAAGRPVRTTGDHVVTPTFVPALVDRALDLLIDGAEGIWHVCDGEPVTRAGFARRLAQACGHDAERIVAVPAHELGWRAPRPANGALASEKLALPGSLDEGLERFARARLSPLR